jgi:uncharacterized RDD family membrane protein YckC
MIVPDSANNANFGSRFMALAIDFVILETIHLLLFILLTGKLIQVVHIEPLTTLTFFALYPFVFSASFLFLHMAYFILFHAWLGQTIGKMLMGIRVVTCDNKLTSPSVAFLRWSGYILSLVPLAIGFLWAAVDKDQCSWHDRLAQTRVVSVEIT